MLQLYNGLKYQPQRLNLYGQGWYYLSVVSTMDRHTGIDQNLKPWSKLRLVHNPSVYKGPMILGETNMPSIPYVSVLSIPSKYTSIYHYES